MLKPLTPKPRTRVATKTVPDWAEALRERRVQLGLSQEDIMARTQDAVSQRSISALETGSTPLTSMALGRVVALARALAWTLAELQRATGLDLGISEAALVAESSADVYPLAAALTPGQPGPAIDHEAVTPGIARPLLLRMDSDEMHGTSPASIRPGDYLHLDLNHTTLEEGRVYVVTDAEGAHARLYASTRLGAVFRADNRSYEDIPAAEVQVVGLVVGVTSDYHPQLN